MPVGWLGRKLDSLAGAVVGAAGAVTASQWREYLQQYLQRLGGHLDEARAQLGHLAGLQEVAGQAQQSVIADMMAISDARVSTLTDTVRGLTEAPAYLQPWVFLRHLDAGAARATLETFRPALPLDMASLAWAAAGLVLALVIYEVFKGVLGAPIVITRRVLRTSRSRKIGRSYRPVEVIESKNPHRERREPRLES